MQNYLYNLATDKTKGLLPGVIKVFLFLLSLIYGAGVKILVSFYRLRPYRLDCKVISVGNITLGGTGKTVLVEYIARYLKSQGRKVAIITRGYKRKMRTAGDIPVIVDADRIRGAKKAIKEYGVDTVILDDAFQQWRLKKDLEIVCLDATRPFGNGKLIPRGILREGLSSLRRADVIILTKTNLNPDVARIRDSLNKLRVQAPVMESSHEAVGFYNIAGPSELINANALKGKSVTLFSGIGDPDSFEKLIKDLGINAGLSFRFRDHYNYTEKDLDKIIENSKAKSIDIVITTEKDAARLYDLRITDCGLRILVLRIKLAIKDEPGFHKRLLKLYSL
jgi:tetraacyldisaccharide 4'-kinase